MSETSSTVAPEERKTAPDNSSVPQRPREKTISEGILLLMIPAAGYLGAYVYELFYLNTFGVPGEFVELTTATLISVGGSMLLAGIVLFQIVHFLWMIDRGGFFARENGYGRYVMKWGIILVWLPVVILIGKFSWFAVVATAPTVLFMVGDAVIPALRKDGKPYKERLAEWLAIPDVPDGKKATLFKSNFGTSVLVVTGCVAMFTLACSTFGNFVAKTRTTFGCVDWRSENVILRRYGERYLLVKFDWSKRQFVRQFSLVSVSAIETPIVQRKLNEWTVAVAEVQGPPPMPQPRTPAQLTGVGSNTGRNFTDSH